jgi:hypothetical protein
MLQKTPVTYKVSVFFLATVGFMQARRSRHGPGQPLDRFPVSPSPCLPRRTYIPVGKKKARLR